MQVLTAVVKCPKCSRPISPTIWDLIPNSLGYVHVGCRSCGESNQVRWVPSLIFWLISLAAVFPLAIPLFSSAHVPTPFAVAAITIFLFLVFRVLLLVYFRRSRRPFANSKVGR